LQFVSKKPTKIIKQNKKNLICYIYKFIYNIKFI
jgi:hypothetical protein